jgi:hypothetical protein
MEYHKVYEVGKPKKRLGKLNDGGYIIIDGLGAYDLYLGCGVANDATFDCDFVPRFCSVGLMFDGTIAHVPNEAKDHTGLTWVRLNIADRRKFTNCTYLEEYMVDKKNVFVKMDIEGGEWPWFEQLSNQDLLRIKQMVVEFHYVDFKSHLDVFTKLAENFYLAHVHINNCGCNTDIVEYTYVRKSEFDRATVGPNKTTLPIQGLDSPNGTHRPEVVLNKYPYVW